MNRPEQVDRGVQVKVALVGRDYRESIGLDEHPVTVLELRVAANKPLGEAVRLALQRAGQPVLGDASALVVMLAELSDATSIVNTDFRRIDASVVDGRARWNDEEWTSNLVTLDGVWNARAEGLYPERFQHLVAFPIVHGAWGDAGYAVVPEVGLWLAEHGVGVAAWFGQALVDNLVPIGVGYAVGRGARARRMRRAVARWRNANTDRPHTLRSIVDRRAAWDVDRLARLLSMDRTEAEQLLRAVGYGKKQDGMWRRAHGRKGRSRREAWIADELDV